jgi:hypothetical protein
MRKHMEAAAGIRPRTFTAFRDHRPGVAIECECRTVFTSSRTTSTLGFERKPESRSPTAPKAACAHHPFQTAKP